MTVVHELKETRRLLPGVFIGECVCGFQTPSVSTRKHAATNVERHARKKNKPPAPCRDRSKRKFPTREAAEASLSTIWARGHRNTRMPARAYLCQCGAWHLTKEPLHTHQVHPTT